VKGLLLAIQFLTIIPVRLRGEITQRQVSNSGVFFPLAGALQGVVVSLGAYVSAQVFPIGLASGLAVLLLIGTNGGFHLDGLADSFDALAVKSAGDDAADRQKRLSVMKDSATGAVGVTAIVMAVLLKYLFIASLFERYDARNAAYLLFLMPVFSKWAMIPVMAHGNPARGQGLGKVFVDGTGVKSVVLSSLLLLAIYASTAFFAGLYGVLRAAVFLCLAALSLYGLGRLWVCLCRRKFGGLTGDTAGAAGEIWDLWFLGIALLSF
jgi:adenosylcobinamide-GDP ribazoletransferase